MAGSATLSFTLPCSFHLLTVFFLSSDPPFFSLSFFRFRAEVTFIMFIPYDADVMMILSYNFSRAGISHVCFLFIYRNILMSTV